MTQASNYSVLSGTGSGATVAVTLSWGYDSDADNLDVEQIRNSDGLLKREADGDFTVTLAGDGLSLTATNFWGTGTAITVYVRRASTASQTYGMTEGEALNPDSLEDYLDKVARIQQEQAVLLASPQRLDEIGAALADADEVSVWDFSTKAWKRSPLSRVWTYIGVYVAALYLTITDAAATYLTIVAAAATYLTKATAAATYLAITTAASTYLTITTAASTYLTIVAAAATYLTQATAAATYLTITTAASTYLSVTTAASTYLSKVTAAATYLTQAAATSTYLTIANAASTYLTTATAATTYLTSALAATTYKPLLLTVSQKSANYTLAASDTGTVVYLYSIPSRSITIPAYASVAIEPGSVIEVVTVGSHSMRWGATVFVNGTANSSELLAGTKHRRLLCFAQDQWVMLSN